ncbi:MAG: RluA family pseudouridine synthase [Treponema sp.]|jgi:23S rRNA pseudouridine955/2504/2580 synthase|nr:RluA family pseudouridine synthase [Treponema sp.]
MIELKAGKDDDGRRLDRILRKALPELSLSLIHRLLRQKKILVDKKPATPNHRIKQGMIIQVLSSVNDTLNQVNRNIVNHNNFSVNKKVRLYPLTSDACSPLPDPSLHCSLLTAHCSLSPVPILWQGSGIIVFNKPQGLSTHGPKSLDLIVNAWLKEEGALPRSLSFRPGPLHRLDKPTSGAIVFSQTLEGARLFSALLRERKIEKTYITIVEGCIKSETREKGKEKKKEKCEYGEIIWRDSLEHDKNAHKSFMKNSPLPSNPAPSLHCSLLIAHCSLSPTPKEAITTVKTLASNDSYSLIEANIKTGRHHQIRAQAASHGHPLAGDIKYGANPLPGQTRGGGFFLHAWKIRFNESPDGFPHEITAPLPEAFQSQIEKLFGNLNLIY